MGFTCILKTNTFLVGRYWDFKYHTNNQRSYKIILFTREFICRQKVKGYSNLKFGHLCMSNLSYGIDKVQT